MLNRPLSFRAGDLETPLHERTDVPETEEQREVAFLSQTADRDLHRYYALLALTLREPTFSEAEASLLVDVCNGVMWEPHTMTLLWANVADALEDGYAEKWGVDGPALLERLRRLSVGGCFAVVDAIERFWHGPYRKEGPFAEGLRAVGLIR